MAELYLIANGVNPTTAAFVKVATGATIKTLLQVKAGRAILRPKVVEWGISFDGLAAALPVACELLTTGTVAATVDAHVAAGIQNLDPLGVTPTDLDPFDWGSTATGYTATGEGSIVATRQLDLQLIAPTNQYVKQWPLGREPFFNPANYLRVRVTAAATVNAYTYVIIEV